jgi:PIN domain nuclease of toxin-antitoxin system
MTLVVLDASALIAVLLKESGSDVVQRHLDGAIISAVNFAEVAAKMLERGATLDLVETEVGALEIDIVPFDRRHAIATARLRQYTKEFGISLADRACLALANLTDRPVLTTDREWTEAGLDTDIRLIR